MSDNFPCPECDASITIANAEVGEVLDCNECSAELEITSNNPIQLALAPEEAEDWGE